MSDKRAILTASDTSISGFHEVFPDDWKFKTNGVMIGDVDIGATTISNNTKIADINEKLDSLKSDLGQIKTGLDTSSTDSVANALSLLIEKLMLFSTLSS